MESKHDMGKKQYVHLGVPPFDDSASFQRESDVRPGIDWQSGDSTPLSWDRRLAAAGNRSDEPPAAFRSCSCASEINDDMVMPPGVRKFALTAHLTCSVGWLGAVAAFLAIAQVALLKGDEQQVRAASIAMEQIGWLVIVPFSAASLVSGVIQSLGTSWGLFRHYWVVAKLLITVMASTLLLLHMQIVSTIALAAAGGSIDAGRMEGRKMQLVADAAAALVILLIAAALSIYKPQGRTDEVAPRWVRISGGVIGLLMIAFVLRHISGGALHSH